MNNPLFIEYYSHDDCDCYKLKMPWSKYREETLVLCKVSDGIDHAITLAKNAIAVRLNEVLNMEIKSNSEYNENSAFIYQSI